MLNFAADDYEEIRKNMTKIAEEETPKCPVSTSKLLRNCLRETARCPEHCQYHADWIGPQEKI